MNATWYQQISTTAAKAGSFVEKALILPWQLVFSQGF
jgi:hypothetical protein